MSLLLDQVDRPQATPAQAPSAPRLRVLVSAYAISPDQGSEPGVGWNICSRLAARHDVTVLCSPSCPGEDDDGFRRETAAYFDRHGPVDGLSLHFVPHSPVSRLLQRETGVARRTTYYAGYRLWQRRAFAAAAALHAQRSFDVVHHLNITGYREPGYLWKLGVPFVWGPVGGASDVPGSFLPLMSWADRCYYALRNAGNAAQKRAARRCRDAARAAAHVWAIGEDNRSMVRDLWGREAEAVLESGTAPHPAARQRRYSLNRPLDIVWSGQHLGRKALPILLNALRLLPAGAAQCTVLGAGPETDRWKTAAGALGVADRVVWTGNLGRGAALDRVAAADVMAFTSVQEGTPHAVLEALSLGVPVVCHDACGMGHAVTGACGIKVPMVDPRTSIAGFADALRRLGSEPGLVERLSLGALRRTEELSWDHLAERIATVYSNVAAKRLSNR